jgi:catechol 2,3-dioxygenase-like lactoylglutathione lyase family enzyme
MRFAHTNIVAKDWKRLAGFYMDVFNCRVKPPERNLSGQWLDQATGLQNARLQGVHLVLPGHGENGPTLEIFTYAQIEDHDLLSANSLGFSHIAFEVEDVDRTLETALEKGAAMLGSISEKHVENVGTLKFVYFRDPEGNIVEIQSWR